MGLKPDEFWDLTPLELNDMVEGLQLKQRFMYEEWLTMLSQHAHWILSQIVRRAPEPEKLFDIEKFRKKWNQMRRKNKMTLEERKKIVQQERERRGKNGH